MENVLKIHDDVRLKIVSNVSTPRSEEKGGGCEKRSRVSVRIAPYPSEITLQGGSELLEFRKQNGQDLSVSMDRLQFGLA